MKNLPPHTILMSCRQERDCNGWGKYIDMLIICAASRKKGSYRSCDVIDKI